MWVVWSLPPQGDPEGPYLHLPCSSASRSSTYIKRPSAFGTQLAGHDLHRLLIVIHLLDQREEMLPRLTCSDRHVATHHFTGTDSVPVKTRCSARRSRP